MDTNKTVLVGRLTRDAELSYTNGGLAILNFSLAVNHRKPKNGNAEEVSYFNCKAFGKIGENLKYYMLKGKQIAITGFLKQERWEKDGQKESRVVVNCEEIQLIGNNQKQENNSYSEDYSYN